MTNDQLAKLHDKQIEILDRVVSICNKYNIRYMLIGGTLLGAVRHGGYIPWDDDLDIAMPRDDYDMFEKVINSELPDDMVFQSSENDEGYYQYFSKVRLNNTIFIEKNSMGKTRFNGIYIDIFPLDYGNKNGFKQKIKNKLFYAMHYYLAKKRNDPSIKRWYFFLLCFLPIKRVLKIRKMATKGSGAYFLNFGSQYGLEKQTMPVNIFLPTKKMVFEGKEYSIPGNASQFLRNLYGSDYMVLPPEEKRVTHDPVRLSFDTNGPDELLN